MIRAFPGMYDSLTHIHGTILLHALEPLTAALVHHMLLYKLPDGF
jgi:hypothetical protein